MRLHQPFRAVGALVHALVDVVVAHELRGAHQVFVIAQRFVYVQCAVVNPLIGIANFYVESIQLFVCLAFGFLCHPGLLRNALAECLLQVLYQFLHALFGRFGEVLLHIHLADRHAQCPFYRTDGAFPARAVLLGTTHRVVVEIESLGPEAVAQRACRIVHRFII